MLLRLSAEALPCSVALEAANLCQILEVLWGKLLQAGGGLPPWVGAVLSAHRRADLDGKGIWGSW